MTSAIKKLHCSKYKWDSFSLRLGRGCFDHGQLYTALSRCRTLEGLQIDRRLVPEDLIIYEAVVRFHAEMERLGRRSEWEGIVSNLREEYKRRKNFVQMLDGLMGGQVEEEDFSKVDCRIVPKGRESRRGGCMCDVCICNTILVNFLHRYCKMRIVCDIILRVGDKRCGLNHTNLLMQTA